MFPRCSRLGEGVVPRHLGSEKPLTHSKAPGYAVGGDVFPGRCGYAQAPQVPFADIPEAQRRATDRTGAFCQFTVVEEVLLNAARFDTLDVAESAQTPLTKKGKHDVYAGSLEDFRVGDFMLPGNV